MAKAVLTKTKKGKLSRLPDVLNNAQVKTAIHNKREQQPQGGAIYNHKRDVYLDFVSTGVFTSSVESASSLSREAVLPCVDSMKDFCPTSGLMPPVAN